MKTCIYNGKIITPETVIEGALYIKKDRIVGIVEGKKDEDIDCIENIDARGNWVMPGIIDCHSDAVELDLQPRPTSIFGIELAFPELEKRLITSGITTMYHSLSILKGGFAEEKTKKYYRTPEGVDKLANWIYEYNKVSPIDHKLHIRYEIDSNDGIPQIKDLIKAGKVDQLSFMDHTPGQGQFRNLEKYKHVVAAYRECSTEDAMAMIEESMAQERMDIKSIEEVAKFAREHNIPVASHDDDTKEKVELLSSWGIEISEFPIALDVAKHAKKKGMYTVMGAPNILLGGSHSGNLSAEEAINHNAVDILCSDYYPSSILHSIFYMQNKGHSLVEMTKLATLNPAKALNISHLKGSLEVGKIADILIVAEGNGIPQIKKILAEGKKVMRIGG